MRRRFHPYTAWEDYAAGMWADSPDPIRDHNRAADLLADPDQLYVAMTAAVAAWPIAAEQNLSDLAVTGRAWLGQAACCHARGVPESETRLAWWSITDEQRTAANAAADRVAAEWRKANADAQTFPW